MKLIWDDTHADIGTHTLTLITDDGEKQDLNLWDYTCPYQQKQKEKDPRGFKYYHPHDYKVSYCRGYCMEEGFDKPMTLEEVKIWAENYLLDIYINHFKNLCEKFTIIKRDAEQAQAIKDAR